VLGTVGKQPVDDHADNGEKEHNKTPEHLVQGWAVRLQDLNCSGEGMVSMLYQDLECNGWRKGVEGQGRAIARTY
jgi:hypothetical protein